jgi:predicted transcriptional regulator
MKTTIQWLDEAKAKHGLSDYALAPKLGIGRAQMSQYRTGKHALSESCAVRLAELLGVDPMLILASAAAERAKSDEVRGIWERAAEVFAGTALSFLAGMILSSPSPASASMKQPQKSQGASVYYVN